MTKNVMLRDIENLILILDNQEYCGIKCVGFIPYKNEIMMRLSFLYDTNMCNYILDYKVLYSPSIQFSLKHNDDFIIFYINGEINKDLSKFNDWSILLFGLNKNEVMIKGYCQFCGNKTVKKQLLTSNYDYCEHCKK